MNFILICLLVLVKGKTVSVGEGMNFGWELEQGSDVIQFTFTYPQKNEQIYNWVGVFCQSVETEDETDRWLKTEQLIAHNSYSESRELVSDSDMNQENKAEQLHVYSSEGNVTLSWKRPLYTGDDLDIIFVIDQTYHFIFVFGIFDERGKLINPEEEGSIIEIDLSLTLDTPGSFEQAQNSEDFEDSSWSSILFLFLSIE